jgi:hypothetical protein
MALGSTQSLTEMNTRNVPGNVGAPTSRNPKGLHDLYTDNFTFYLCIVNTLSEGECEHTPFVRIHEEYPFDLPMSPPRFARTKRKHP